MGNATTKLTRKFDGWLKRAHKKVFKESQQSEISDDSLSDVEQNQSVSNQQQNNDSNHQQDQEPNQEIEENMNTHSYQMESIIHTSITKEEFLQDKRKASILLQFEFDPKKVCPNKETMQK